MAILLSFFSTLGFILTIAAAEVAIGLALIVSLYRARRTASTQDLNTLKD